MLFEHLLSRDTDVLDIGAGAACWTRKIAKTAGRCVAIDISRQVLTRQPGDSSNLEFYIMNAGELGFPANSFDIAFRSHQSPDSWRKTRGKHKAQANALHTASGSE